MATMEEEDADVVLFVVVEFFEGVCCGVCRGDCDGGGVREEEDWDGDVCREVEVMAYPIVLIYKDYSFRSFK